MLCVLKAEVTELEVVSGELHEGFQSLDQQMSRASQTATKIGDRLQVMHIVRPACNVVDTL